MCNNPLIEYSHPIEGNRLVLRPFLLRGLLAVLAVVFLLAVEEEATVAEDEGLQGKVVQKVVQGIRMVSEVEDPPVLEVVDRRALEVEQVLYRV